MILFQQEINHFEKDFSYFFFIFSGIVYKSTISPSTRFTFLMNSSWKYSFALRKDRKSTRVFSEVVSPILNNSILFAYFFISLVVFIRRPVPVITPKIIGFSVIAPAIVPAVISPTEARLKARFCCLSCLTAFLGHHQSLW